MSNAIITSSGDGTYIDVPISIQAQGEVHSFDFWLKFNETKLTYFSTLTVVEQLDAFSNFNTTNHYLSNTTSGPSTAYVVPNNETLLYIRFKLASPCVEIGTADFVGLNSLLNGTMCRNKVVSPSNNALEFNNTPGVNCSNSTIPFHFPSTYLGKTITSWSWDFGNGNYSNGQNPTTLFTDGGSYTIALSITTNIGCTYNFTSNLIVNETAISNFDYTIDPATDTVFFNNIVTSIDPTVTWVWDFGDGGTSIVKNPTHFYTSGGTYTVSLTSKIPGGCSHTFITQVIINKPTAAFTFVGKCINSVIPFVQTSTYPGGTIASYSWDFGDGTTSTEQNPNHSYSTVGNFAVKLTVTGTDGRIGFKVETVQIHGKPIVQFDAEQPVGCAPLRVNFNNLTNTVLGSTFQWKFGNGLMSAAQNPASIYLVGGLFDVKLIVTTSFGCSDSLTKTNYINVHQRTHSDFVNSPACVNTPINFTNQSQGLGTTITNTAWVFGDGGTATNLSPTHLFVNAGNFNVRLVTINNLGCSDTMTKVLYLNHKPTVQFFAPVTSGCAPLAVNFTNLSTTVANSTYAWKFGDSETGTNQNPAHTYVREGQFDVKLIVTAPGGCSDSLTMGRYINAFNALTPAFSDSNRCATSATYFKDLTTVTTGTISSWSWNFGNGNSSTSQNPTFMFTNPGTYVVTLAVTSNQGCSNSLTKNVIIDQIPKANFTVDHLKGCIPMLVQFKNQSNTVANSSYTWNIGNSIHAHSADTAILFAQIGTFPVQLIVKSPQGCKDSLTSSQAIEVQTAPIAQFQVVDSFSVVPKAKYDFENQSSHFTSLIWDFGDHYQSNLINPSHTYESAGTYTMCLIAQSSFGCQDTTCREIKISESHALAIPNTFSPNGDGHNDVFKVRGGPFSQLEVSIYNEWGNQIFRTTDPNFGWDGTFHGENQPIGVYEYTVKGKTLANDVIDVYGTVNLNR